MEDDLQLEEYDNTETLAEDVGEFDDEDLIDDEELEEITQAKMSVDFDDIEEEDPDDVGFDDVDEEVLDQIDGDIEIEEIEEDDEEDYEGEETSITAKIKSKLQGLFSKKSQKDDLGDLEEIDDEMDDEENLSFKGKMEKTLKTVVDHKLPMLGNLLNKNKDKETVAVDTDGNELDELDLEENEVVQEKVGAKTKITPIHIIVVIGLVFLFWPDEEPKAPEPVAKKIVKKHQPPKKKAAPVIEDVKKGVEEIKKAIVDSGTKKPLNSDMGKKAEEPIKKIEKTPIEEDPEIKKIDLEVAKKIEKVENSNPDLEALKTDNQEPIKKEEEKKTNKEIKEEVKVENVADADLESLDEDADSNTDAAPTEEIDLGDIQTIDTPVIENQTDVAETKNDGMDTNVDIVDTSTDDEVVKVDEVITQMPEEIIPQQELQPDASTEITKKLLKDLEVRLKEEKKVQKTLSVVKPTAAPSYEITGLGLVYNCKDGHWACIEQEEYSKCRQNYSWNKNEGIPLECYPVAFLKTEYDCAMVQQEKIDSVSDTGFCQM